MPVRSSWPVKTFAVLAVAVSDDPSAARNKGRLGPYPRGKFDPAFEAAAFALQKPGDVSEPVLTRFGYHVIRLEGRTPARQQTFDEVRAQILAEMRQKYVADARDTTISAIRGDPRLEVNQEAVDALVVKVDFPALPGSPPQGSRACSGATGKAVRRPQRRMRAPVSPPPGSFAFGRQGGSCYPPADEGPDPDRRRRAGADRRRGALRGRDAPQPRAVRQLLPARAHDALSRQRHRPRVGAAPSAGAARRLPLRLHDDLSRRELRRDELSALRRGRAVAVARRAGRAAARDGQPRQLRRADPQGRVSARARRLRVGRGHAHAAVRGLPRRARRARRLRRARALRRAADRGAAVARARDRADRHRAVPRRAAGVHPRRRARARAGADDPDVPDADPVSADARARAACGPGSRPIRSAGSSTACATRCSTAGSRCNGATPWRSRSRSRCSSAGAGCFGGCRRTSRTSCDAGRDRAAAAPRRRRQGLRESRLARRPGAPRLGPAARARRGARLPRARRRRASSCGAANRSA